MSSIPSTSNSKLGDSNLSSFPNIHHNSSVERSRQRVQQFFRNHIQHRRPNIGFPREVPIAPRPLTEEEQAFVQRIVHPIPFRLLREQKIPSCQKQNIERLNHPLKSRVVSIVRER